jgi:hypothetical protein
MTTDRDVIRIVTSWLREEQYEDANRVLETVLDLVDATPQRRRDWIAWRVPIVNSPILRLSLATTALAAAVLVGANLLFSSAPVGPAQTGRPTPAPTLGATPSPSPIDLTRAFAGRSLEAGTYSVTIGKSPRRFSVQLTLPDGWQLDTRDQSEVAFTGPDASYLGFFAVLRVYRDPCHPEKGFAGDYLSPSNSMDLEHELAALVGFHASDVESLTVGSRPARYFVLSNSIDTEKDACTDGQLLRLFATMDADRTEPGLNDRAHSPATNGGTTQHIWVVSDGSGLAANPDGGIPALIVGETGRGLQATKLNAIRSILASLQFVFF